MNTQLADKTFYTSATKKIHSTECRHCRPDNKGWQKIDSLLSAIDEGYQLCRTCCPSEDEIRSLSPQSNSIPVTEIKTEYTLTEDTTETVNQNENKTESSEDKNDTTTVEEVVVAEKTEDKTTKEEKIQTEVADSNTIAETSKTEEVSKAKTSEEATETKSDIDSPPTSETAKTEVEVSEDKTSEEATENKSDSETQGEGETKSKKKRKRKKKKKKKQVEGEAESESGEKPEEEKKEEEPPKEKKFFKVLAGNGCHQAIAEVQGILIPPLETDGKFTLILSDGMQLEVLFRNPRLRWLVYNQSGTIGMHWFRGYPKMQNDKLVGLQVIAWDGNMLDNKPESESWEFIGVWTLQKNLTVQRSVMNQEVLKIAEETGFVKKFKYSFNNAYEWMKTKKLWVGYVYKLICQREGDKFKIMKVIPYACPRKKPVPKDNKPPFNKGKGKFNPENKGDKKQDKNQDNTSKKQTNEIANDNKGKENKTKENKAKTESSKNE